MDFIWTSFGLHRYERADAFQYEGRGLEALASACRAVKAVGHAAVEQLSGACGRLSLSRNVQAACYDGNGSHYQAHTDNMPKDPASVTHWPPSLVEQSNTLELRSWRVFTCMLYAQDEDWTADHGGCLRVHHEAGGFTDVQPRGGRCVVFNALLSHEVRPAFCARWALTLWLWREDGDERKYLLS